jgi:hypothetical protein
MQFTNLMLKSPNSKNIIINYPVNYLGFIILKQSCNYFLIQSLFFIINEIDNNYPIDNFFKNWNFISIVQILMYKCPNFIFINQIVN